MERFYHLPDFQANVREGLVHDRESSQPKGAVEVVARHWMTEGSEKLQRVLEDAKTPEGCDLVEKKNSEAQVYAGASILTALDILNNQKFRPYNFVYDINEALGSYGKAFKRLLILPPFEDVREIANNNYKSLTTKATIDPSLSFFIGKTWNNMPPYFYNTLEQRGLRVQVEEMAPNFKSEVFHQLDPEIQQRARDVYANIPIALLTAGRP